jgi:hypothetical protein
MKKTRYDHVIMALLLLTLPCAALAAGPGVFSMHDSNADGFLDRGEYAVFLSRLWSRRAQRLHHGPLPPPLAFDAIDANADGRISEEELLNSLESRLRHRRWRGGWSQ